MNSSATPQFAQASDWPLVSLVVPCYNAVKFLPTLIPSILALDYPNLEIIFADDYSTDNTVQQLKNHLLTAGRRQDITIIEHQQNLGFVATVNELFWSSHGQYFFMVNQDTIHSSDYLKIAVQKMQENPEIATLGGKIYKYDFENHRPTTIIDTVGQIIYRNRRIVDEGQGTEDQGQFEESKEVFGISGQNPLYRRSALLQVAIPIHGQPHPELFDQDFFMYKEDVDLAWRLRLFGWKAWYEPKAVAWHGRGTSAVKRLSKIQIVKNRGQLSSFQKYYSIKNRYLLMAKNEFSSLFFQNFWRILSNDLLYLVYNLLFNPIVALKAYYVTVKQLPAIWRKRQYLVKNRSIKANQLHHWYQ